MVRPGSSVQVRQRAPWGFEIFSMCAILLVLVQVSQHNGGSIDKSEAGKRGYRKVERQLEVLRERQRQNARDAFAQKQKVCPACGTPFLET